MSVFHYKAILESRDEDGFYIYRYFPDHVMAEGVSGLYRVNPDTFDAEIIERAGAEEKGLASTDERCVSATVWKIKVFREKEGAMPERVFWTA